MRTLRTDILAAAECLPPGSVLSLDGVTWDEYEDVLAAFENPPGIRITYDCGRLDIVTTSVAHDRRKDFILRMVHVLSEELKVEVESVGGTTEKRERDLKGTEPDTSFYVGNIERILGKEELDLETDPPPDVVVEIDKSRQSLRKFPIYAAFRVPEIWRYDAGRKRASIHELRGERYVEIPASRFFPLITPEALVRFTEQSIEEGQSRTLAAFRAWIRATRTA